MDVVLDTSALLNVTDRGCVAQLSEGLIRRRARVLIPREVVAELLAQDDHDRAWGHFSTLRSIDPGCEVIITEGFGGIHTIEKARVGLERHRPEHRATSAPRTPLMRTPRIPRDESTQLLARLRNRAAFESSSDELRTNSVALLDKERTHALDRRARENALRIQAKMEPDHFLEWIDTWTPARLLKAPMFFEWLVPKEPHRRRMVRHPHLFATSLSWAACQELTAWGVVQKVACPGTLPELEGPRRNTWADNKIAASAAYADRFVTDDIGQAFKAAHAFQSCC